MKQLVLDHVQCVYLRTRAYSSMTSDEVRDFVISLRAKIMGVKLLPWEPCEGDYVRYEVGADRNEGCFAKVWRGSDDRYHITFEYGVTFGTVQEAMIYQDDLLVSAGAILIPDKLMAML